MVGATSWRSGRVAGDREITERPNSLLLVIPPVVDLTSDGLRIDGDFASNVTAYLDHFDKVRVLCPATTSSFTFPSTCALGYIVGAERLSIGVLPLPYREDRYLRNLRAVSRQLKRELAEYEYRLISPHSAFDWSTLAAEICIERQIPYNMEADWNLPEVRADLWAKMPWGPNKLRRWFWRKRYDRKYFRCLEKSALALLQGGDVYHDLASFAPNPHCVLNVQVGREEHVGAAALVEKIRRIEAGQTVRIGYAGRASDIKGPFHWLDVVTQLRDWGCDFHATWAGDGEELAKMRSIVETRNLGSACSLVGKLARDRARDLIADSDLFLFCHLAKESPRCLMESLAFGTPIVGFGTNYAKQLVSPHGGGALVDRGNTRELAGHVRSLIEDRTALAMLTRAAAASGEALQKDDAIAERIGLIKQHLGRGVLR